MSLVASQIINVISYFTSQRSNLISYFISQKSTNTFIAYTSDYSV